MNSVLFRCEGRKYLGSITDNSMIAFDEVIEKIKNVPTKVLQQNCSDKIYLNKFLHLSSLFINHGSIIDGYLIKYHKKQKPLLPYKYTISIPYQYTISIPYQYNISRLKKTEY